MISVVVACIVETIESRTVHSINRVINSIRIKRELLHSRLDDYRTLGVPRKSRYDFLVLALLEVAQVGS